MYSFLGKIGIMGGTFNPIHIAHISMAEAAYRQAGLDKVVFMPSKNPPHKQDISIIPEKHRKAMIKLAISGIPYFEYSDFEFEREGITYSANTLEILCKMHPENKYYFIMGGDSFFQIESWYMPEKIMEFTTLLVINRNGSNKEQLLVHSRSLKEKYNAKVMFVDMPRMDISSSGIRKLISSGGNATRYLPLKVAEYIKDNKCYM